jgi:dTDP-4-dehydrorhamnose reductase
MKTKILILGGSGMLGSMLIDVFSKEEMFDVTATVRAETMLVKYQERIPTVRWKIFDASGSKEDVVQFFSTIPKPQWVINAIGLTKPMIHDDNAEEVEAAIRINSLLPHVLGMWAGQQGSQVIQIATDCVYSGIKGRYVESDIHDPLDVYGKTKSLGETMNSNVHHLRCSIIGPEVKDFKFLIEWFLRQPPGSQISGYINHYWNGLTTLHFAKICCGVIKENLVLDHLQHIVPTGIATKAEMLAMFSKYYRRKDISIKEVSAEKAINRILITEKPTENLDLWRASGYKKPPTIEHQIEELSRYKLSLIDGFSA